MKNLSDAFRRPALPLTLLGVGGQGRLWFFLQVDGTRRESPVLSGTRPFEKKQNILKKFGHILDLPFRRHPSVLADRVGSFKENGFFLMVRRYLQRVTLADVAQAVGR